MVALCQTGTSASAVHIVGHLATMPSASSLSYLQFPWQRSKLLFLSTPWFVEQSSSRLRGWILHVIP